MTNSTIAIASCHITLDKLLNVYELCLPCVCRPEQHGEDMLSLISGVIGQSHDPLAVSMVIEGLMALCQAEVQFIFLLVICMNTSCLDKLITLNNQLTMADIMFMHILHKLVQAIPFIQCHLVFCSCTVYTDAPAINLSSLPVHHLALELLLINSLTLKRSICKLAL